MSGRQASLEAFRIALSGASRAIAQEPELGLDFAGHIPSQIGKSIRIPTPDVALSAADIAAARGFADALALRLRFHDAEIHSQLVPSDPDARVMFDAVEQVRIEAIGAKGMAGIAANLVSALDVQLRADPITYARIAADVPLPTAIALIVRERIGAAIPETARAGVELVRGHIEEKAGTHIDALALLLDDQAAFASSIAALLRALDPGASPYEEAAEPSVSDQPAAIDEGNEAEAREQASEEDEQAATPDERDDPVDDAAKEERPPAPRPEVPSPPRERPYQPFTTRYDQIVHAPDLCDKEELAALRARLDEQLQASQGLVTRLANRLQRRLMAQQHRSWDFDQEEGLLDAARLARVVSSPGQSLSYKVERDSEFRHTAVTILIDNSGSMRGRPIGVAATSVDILARTLERCGVKVEILGFTTGAWKGGEARAEWLATRRPARPGRLNELLHIIYKHADEPWRRARAHLGLMLRDGLLKENIDGEALLWAHERLLARPESRRILMVVSDGAPADEATLGANDPGYLEAHLRKVVRWIEATSPVHLVAIGIGHDVTRYYKRAVRILDVDQLGGTMIGQLADLFDAQD
ncbi:MAG: cobaltochelatase CobT [Rhizorhabdus sp.]|nr:cobaltochelatase CobT [Rhizorhabdus sp.]